MNEHEQILFEHIFELPTELIRRKAHVAYRRRLNRNDSISTHELWIIVPPNDVKGFVVC